MGANSAGTGPTTQTPSPGAPGPGGPLSTLTAVGLDPRERLAGLAGAALAAVGFAVIWVPHLSQATPKGHQAAAVYLAIGLIEAVALAGCTLLRRRYLVGFAALVIAFGPWNTLTVLAFPFLALAGWTLFRATRLARQANADRASADRANAGRGQPSTPRQGSLRATRTATRQSERAATAGPGGSAEDGSRGIGRRATRGRRGQRGRAQEPANTTGRRRPAASKRYTPPKPPTKAQVRAKALTKDLAKGASKGEPES